MAKLRRGQEDAAFQDLRPLLLFVLYLKKLVCLNSTDNSDIARVPLAWDIKQELCFNLSDFVSDFHRNVAALDTRAPSKQGAE